MSWYVYNIDMRDARITEQQEDAQGSVRQQKHP